MVSVAGHGKNKGNVNGCWSGHVPIPRFRSKLVSWGSLGVETTINNNYCVRSISGRYILNIPLPTWSKTRYACNSVRNATSMLKNVEKNVEKSKIIKKKCWKSKYVPNTIIFVDPFLYLPAASAHRLWAGSGVGNLTGRHPLCPAMLSGCEPLKINIGEIFLYPAPARFPIDPHTGTLKCTRSCLSVCVCACA